MSLLSLEKNGRISSSKRTKHIKAKYFLIKNHYDSGEIDLCYCPTDVMWADVLTKPLQGQKFGDMRAFLQNCPRDYDNEVEFRTDQLARKSMNQQAKTVASLWECVEEQTNLELNPPRSHTLGVSKTGSSHVKLALGTLGVSNIGNSHVKLATVSRSPTSLQVSSKRHVGPKKESLYNTRRVHSSKTSLTFCCLMVDKIT
jgi:hypothetical protein